MELIFEHIAITVSDLNKSILFYTEVFGFILARRTETSAYLYLGTDLLELMQSISPHDVDEPNTPEEWWEKAHGPIGLSHFGLRVDNMDIAIEQITGAGGRLVKPPYFFKPQMNVLVEVQDDKLRRAIKGPEKGCRIAYAADPDGVIIELLER